MLLSEHLWNANWEYLSFPTSSSRTENDDHWKENVKNTIGLHLDRFADKFICYFPENCFGNTVHKLVYNLFSADVDSLPDILQEEALNENRNLIGQEDEISNLEECLEEIFSNLPQRWRRWDTPFPSFLPWTYVRKNDVQFYSQ